MYYDTRSVTFTPYILTIKNWVTVRDKCIQINVKFIWYTF